MQRGIAGIRNLFAMVDRESFQQVHIGTSRYLAFHGYCEDHNEILSLQEGRVAMTEFIIEIAAVTQDGICESKILFILAPFCLIENFR